MPRHPRPERRRLITRSINLYPDEWAILDQIAIDREMKSTSALIRSILLPTIAEYQAQRAPDPDAPEPE